MARATVRSSATSARTHLLGQASCVKSWHGTIRAPEKAWAIDLCLAMAHFRHNYYDHRSNDLETCEQQCRDLSVSLVLFVLLVTHDFCQWLKERATKGSMLNAGPKKIGVGRKLVFRWSSVCRKKTWHRNMVLSATARTGTKVLICMLANTFVWLLLACTSHTQTVFLEFLSMA